MARKAQVQIQENLETDEEFEEYLKNNSHLLICMEVYSGYCGHCAATANAIRKIKMEIGQEHVSLAKAMSDRITALSRFKGRSEPVFLFILDGSLTQAVFGAKAIELIAITEEELGYLKRDPAIRDERPRYDITEMLPVEAERLEEIMKIEKEHQEIEQRLRVVTLAARKRRVCERLVTIMNHYNYIIYWPHCLKAHLELYEQWDIINIQVGAKEMIQLKEEDLKEVFYMSDVDVNEACAHALLAGECMVVLFKMFETDTRNFVNLLRRTVYEDIPIPKEDAPPEKRLPPIPAYERYATISKSAREVRRERYNIKLEELERQRQEAERLAREQSRLLRQAEEDRLAAEKQRKEEERFARIQAGLPPEPEPEPEPEVQGEGSDVHLKTETETTITDTETAVVDQLSDVTVPEEKQAEEEFHSDVSVEGEPFIPQGGLFVPGIYAPPNELAKVNGLVFFFPKVVSKFAAIESEYLPPHVLIMFTVDKRNDVNEVIKNYRSEILQLGVFVGDDPFSAEHVAYTLKQYEKMERLRRHLDRLALMVSRKRSLAMLQLAGLNPCYISSDVKSGERECLTLFPVGYGDDYLEEESFVEEEAKPEEPEVQVEAVGDEQTKVEEEENEDA